MQRYRRVAVLALVLLVVAATVVACLWDYDTLRTEAAGLPGLVEIITGRFERNPPLYYEMRLQRSQELLVANANDWDAYDNAGVACDRLQRYDEAIEWMQRKHDAMESADLDEATQFTHHYRYLANLGTFHAHRWLAGGASRDDLSDLNRGIELIEAAIELNPDAHFGRERYQLLAMRWMAEPPDYPYGLPPIYAANASFQQHLEDHGLQLTGYLQATGFDDAIQGISGLIALGNAWESVDIFYALTMALNEDKQSSIARLAQLRLHELVRAGHRSLHPEAPDDEDNLISVTRIHGWAPYDEVDIDAYYGQARLAADAWHEHRVNFMLTRLESGRHPDTDANFWQGYEPLPPIALPHGILGTGMRWSPELVMVILIGLVVGLLMVVVMRRLKAKAAAPG